MSEEEDLKYLQTEYEENIITELIKKVESLQNQLQQKENIIKEVREYIKFELEEVLKVNRYDLHYHTIDGLHIKRILEILDKGGNE